jgi:hypothetical protein
MKTLLHTALIVFLFSCFSENLYAQFDDKTIDTLCNCVSKIDIKKKGDVVEKEAQQCIVNIVATSPEIIKAIAEKPDNAYEVGKKIGKDMVIELLSKCPAATQVFMIVGANKKESETSDNTSSKSSSVVGTIARMDTKGYVTITIRTEDRDITLLWLRHFIGSEKLKDGVTELKRNKVKFQYKEIEVYNPILKDYTTMKEITSFEIIQ